jgi:hypothetical protein
MSSAVIMWFVFVILVCAIISISLEAKAMDKKDREIRILRKNREIRRLRLENNMLREQNAKQEIKIKFMEHSNYYEELSK